MFQQRISLRFGHSLLSEEGGETEAELLASINQVNCRHGKHGKYDQRTFDILNGFQIVATKCCGCDKTLELAITKLGKH